MGQDLVVSCDYMRDRTTKCGKPGRKSVEAVSGNRTFRMDVCGEDVVDVERDLMAMGFTVQSKTGSKMRRAYVSKSGRTFSTNEARDWLTDHGHEVPAAGRLSGEMLQIYADAH